MSQQASDAVLQAGEEVAAVACAPLQIGQPADAGTSVVPEIPAAAPDDIAMASPQHLPDEPTPPTTTHPGETEDFVDSIFDMQGVAESLPVSPAKFISPMKLHHSANLTPQEVNRMFAVQ
jgi:hypothetical protein